MASIELLWSLPRLNVVGSFRFGPGDNLPCKRLMVKAVIVMTVPLIECHRRDENTVSLTLEVHSVFAIEEGAGPARI